MVGAVLPTGSVGVALRRTTALLREAGFRTPRLDAEVLLGHVTGFPRELLLAHPEQTLTPEQVASFEGLVARRLVRCPVAYLVGRKEFMSLDFEVGPGVLIPRPETELLVEVASDLALQRLADRGTGAGAAGRTSAVPAQRDLVLADVGTGSGAVAVSLARLVPEVLIYATDLFEQALACAGRNAGRLLGDAGRVLFRCGDLLAGLGSEHPLLDGVVANLPYVPDVVWESLEPNVRDYEPPQSLRGGPDGLDLFRRLAGQLPAYLAPGAFVALEVGPEQAPAVAALLVGTGLFDHHDVSVHRDLAGAERVVAATSARPAGESRA